MKNHNDMISLIWAESKKTAANISWRIYEIFN